MSKEEQAYDFSQAPALSQEHQQNMIAANDENAEQKMAFESYYRMGHKRSLQRVADQIGRSVKTLEIWSSQFRWTSRIKERDKIAAEHSLNVQRVVEEEELRNKHIKAYDQAINLGVSDIINGNIKVKNVDEVIKLVNARWQLAGLAEKQKQTAETRNTQINIHGDINLGLDRMDRSEKLKLLHSMLEGISKVTSRTEKKMIEDASVVAEVIEEGEVDIDGTGHE